MAALDGKRHLRRLFRDRRRSLGAAEQADHAQRIAAALAEHFTAHLAPRDVVAVYLARDGEADLTPCIDRCWQRGIEVAVPVIAGRALSFAAYRRDEPMRAGSFGIPEPAAPEWREPTVVLTPLVAFDAHGARLGMGGGYYDRCFRARPQALRVGIAHECQRADALPADAWDMPLHAVATECGWQSFAPGAAANAG